MSSRDDFERQLEKTFLALRADDRGVTPGFSQMLSAANAEVEALPSSMRDGVGETSRRRGKRFRFVVVAGPLLAAAGLAAVWFSPARRAEREFDRVVTEWIATSGQAMHAPTDELLAVPGGEYLRSVPAIGRGLGDFRRGS